MFKQPVKLKVYSIIIIVLDALGIAYRFLTTLNTQEDVKEIMDAKQAKTRELHHKYDAEVEQRHQSGFARKAIDFQENADFAQDETMLTKALHQLRARPYAATFVGAFFFFMLSLGALVFHAIQYVSEAGWSRLFFSVFEGIHIYVLPVSIIFSIIILVAGPYFYPSMDSDLVAQDEILQGKSVYLNMPGFIIRM